MSVIARNYQKSEKYELEELVAYCVSKATSAVASNDTTGSFSPRGATRLILVMVGRLEIRLGDHVICGN